MNRFTLNAFAAALLLLSTTRVSAEDFSAVNNEGVTIYYNYLNGTTGSEVEVTFRGNFYNDYDEYTGDIVIPESVTYSGNTYAVTAIGDDAFSDCIGLISVITGNTVKIIGGWAFTDCIGLTSIIIGNTVTTIDEEAFWGCLNLTSVTIGESVTVIGTFAFADCSAITTITSLAINPPLLGTGVFGETSKTIPIHVPCGSVTAYKAASGWSDFNDYSACIAGNNIETYEAAIVAITLYPNPVKDAISITMQDNTSQVTFMLYDIQGRQLVQQDIHTENTVSVAHLSLGMYIYTILTEGKRITGKIVKE
jgi:hypothetical protein